jgi:Arc/MetJ-type ribon-helix-helix transcriptional regulator
MMIYLCEHVERFVRDQVQAGFFRSEDDVIRDALERHRQTQQPQAKAPGQPSLTPQEIAKSCNTACSLPRSSARSSRRSPT